MLLPAQHLLASDHFEIIAEYTTGYFRQSINFQEISSDAELQALLSKTEYEQNNKRRPLSEKLDYKSNRYIALFGHPAHIWDVRCSQDTLIINYKKVVVGPFKGGAVAALINSAKIYKISNALKCKTIVCNDITDK